MNLILLEPGEAGADGTAVLRGRRARHAREVLRAAPGQVLRVGVIDGPRGEGTVLEAAADTLALACRFAAAAPPVPAADLLLALPRPKVLRRLYAPLAMLGIGRLLLANAEKVERMYFDTHVLDPAFRRARLLEGLEQAGDTRLPRVTVHRRLKVLVEDELDALCPAPLRLFGEPGAAPPPRGEAGAAPARRTLLAVGPEGGWTPYERDLLRAHGFAPAGVGERVLRSDVACLALLTLVHAALRADPPAPLNASG